MAEFLNVVIGIQARSTSKRFPRKVFETIGDRTMIEHVICAALTSANYVNYKSNQSGVRVEVALLIPEGDKELRQYSKRLQLIEGSEDDVLSRYVAMQYSTSADYIVRITGDCPLIQPHVITKHINVATSYEFDYLSNVDEECRTSPDGWDCEVMSARFLDYISKNVKEKSDREHVTTFGRREPPSWAKVGQVIGYLDMSDLKLSVDTPEDLERVRMAYERVQTSLKKADERHGRGNIYRL